MIYTPWVCSWRKTLRINEIHINRQKQRWSTLTPYPRTDLRSYSRDQVEPRRRKSVSPTIASALHNLRTNVGRFHSAVYATRFFCPTHAKRGVLVSCDFLCNAYWGKWSLSKCIIHELNVQIWVVYVSRRLFTTLHCGIASTTVIAGVSVFWLIFIGVGSGWVGAVLTAPLSWKLMEFILLVGVPKSSMGEVLLLAVVAVFFSCSCGMFILCSLRSTIACSYRFKK